MSSISNVDVDKKVKADKLFELDYMRFVACFAVMIVHITANGIDSTGYIHGSFPYMIMLIINRCFKFTTPVFIFLSGVTSFYSYRKREFKYFPYIKKRLKHTLVAYFVWCVIYYEVYIYLGYYTRDINFFMEHVRLGNMSYHLYFVVIITQMYIVGPVFYKLLKNSDKRITILIASAIITCLCARYMNFQYADRVLFKYMFFYMLGIYVTLEYEKYVNWIKRNKAKIASGYVVSAAIYTMASYYGNGLYMYAWFVFSTFSIFFVYLIGLYLKKALGNIYSFIKLFGQSSYYIYLMHPLILTLMIMYTDNNGILSVTKRLIIYFLTVIPITVISCLVFTAIKNRFKKYRKSKKAAVSA